LFFYFYSFACLQLCGPDAITSLKLVLFVHLIVQVLLSLFESHYYCDLMTTSWFCGKQYVA
jgi:hypothetical protein